MGHEKSNNLEYVFFFFNFLFHVMRKNWIGDPPSKGFILSVSSIISISFSYKVEQESTLVYIVVFNLYLLIVFQISVHSGK